MALSGLTGIAGAGAPPRSQILETCPARVIDFLADLQENRPATANAHCLKTGYRDSDDAAGPFGVYGLIEPTRVGLQNVREGR